MKPFSFAATKRPASSANIGTPMRRMRVAAVALCFVVWLGVIALRLVWLQVWEHRVYAARAAKQEQRTLTVSPHRGALYDRDLRQLAMTVQVDSVYAVPGEIPAERRPVIAEELARILHSDASDHFTEASAIEKRLNTSRFFTWIARKQDPAVIARVQALKLKGVYLQKEYKRFYPENSIAAQVLGYVGTDDNGLGGVEQKFDAGLHGTNGEMLTALDARRHVLGSEEREPEAGESLQLTIDSNIQFMAEQALEHAMARVKPINGTVVVQDPHTGQILALAMRPTFNPNDVKHTSPELLRDHAVSDVYEPGSTFKLVAYSAALEEKVTTPEQKIDCEGGRIVVAGRTVHDDHYNGVLTTSQALWESSDVAAIKLAMRMGKDTYYKYVHGYGFGQRSGIEVPGETRGLLKPPQRWQPTTIGSIPMGQEVGVTPIQLVTMASTIANGGTYLPPRLVLQQASKPETRLAAEPFRPSDALPDTLPEGAHRVISTMTSAEMRKMLEGVVLYGTARGRANLNGYSAAGKTGTAQKIDVRTHTYSKTKYIASFVGFAPVNDPAITVAVIIDSPSQGGHHGADVSAPVFQELAQQILEYLGVAHDEPVLSKAEMAGKPKAPDVEGDTQQPAADLDAMFAEVNQLPADDPLRNAAAPVQDVSSEDAEAAGAGTPAGALPAVKDTPAAARIHVPSFVGNSVRKVAEQAAATGLPIEMLGTGLARAQAPAPGTLVPAGTEVVVRFGR
jgi:cell division protein FtsI (penicillin-binding protein 3)